MSLNCINHLKKYLALYCQLRNGYLAQRGFWLACRLQESVGRDGLPVPWICYPAVDFLAARLTRTLCVLEFGGGASTAFFCQYCSHVLTVENNESWFQKLEKQNFDNSEIVSAPDQIKKSRQFDILVLDSHPVEARYSALLLGIELLKQSGVVLLDDTKPENLTKLEPCFQFLQKNGFRRLDFVGPKPGDLRENFASIFYRQGNCLDL